MDQLNFREKIMSFIGQYRYVILVVLIGLVLMMIPDRNETAMDSGTEVIVPETVSTQEMLEDILSQIEGVGKVRVLLTILEGERTFYEYDEDTSDTENSGSVRRDTVIISDENRAEQGLIQQVIPPTYLGAIVVCQGGDKPSIQLAIVEAVSNTTGLSADRITVLKMK